jgi:hypothetical protein
MKIIELINETPLPSDWDSSKFNTSNSFKSIVDYALERSKKIGTGSSRIAFEVEYEGRPTILKIAKNKKGLAQNEVESKMLSDGYIEKMELTIPLIDYDTTNIQPLWIHTEKADKVTEKKLCKLLHCDNLFQLIQMVEIKYKHSNLYTRYYNELKELNTEDELEELEELVDNLYSLSNDFDIALGDFEKPDSWGLYKGKPVIIDIGLSMEVYDLHYKL